MATYHKTYHTIVLGVGGMGSAAVYELARRGKRVLGIEKFDIPNTMGSSHGYTRIIRKAYYEDPSYVTLIKRAYELWQEIERRSGRQLLVQTGSLDIGPADSWVFKGSRQSSIDHNLVHEILTGREINQRYPGYRLPEDLMGVYQPEGGFLIPEASTVAYIEAAHQLGGEVHGRETVLSWEPDGDGVRVITDRDQYLADSLVITAGAWNPQILPILNGLAIPERQVLAWLQPYKPEYFTPGTFPVFNILVPEGRFYGFPVHGVPGFKFGKYHHFQEMVNPEYYNREPLLEDEQMLREFSSRYFPDGSGPTMSLVACMFTNSPDNHFIIDLHPDYPQVSFASGFSGHGYKFASVIGEILADLADWGKTRHNIQLFNLARFTGRVSQLYQDHPGLQRERPYTRVNRSSLRQNYRRELISRRAARGVPIRPQDIPVRPGRRSVPGNQAGYHPRSHLRRGSLFGKPVTDFSDRTYTWDTADPRYWEQDDIKTFW
ncbi:MAG: N-methyl-L-tryptophan oxidase [Anaerolineales bacterium]